MKEYLEAVNLSQRELAGFLTVSPAAVNTWCNDQRAPTREIAISIARIIDKRATEKKLYEQKQSPLCGSDMGFILVDLLQKAGFEVVDNPIDVIWNRVAYRTNTKVKVGWMQVPPFASKNEGERLALDITETMLSMLGATMVGHELASWTELTTALRSHEIDIIAPILAASPHHLATLQFSTSIGVMMRHVCLLPREARKHLIDGRVNDLSQFILLQVEDGGISEMFASMHQHASFVRERFNQLQEAVERLGMWTEQDGLPPCIIVAEPHAEEIIKFSPKQFAKARLPVEVDLPLPLAFGIPHNEARLRSAINSTVSAMKRSGLIAGLLKKYRDRMPNLLVEGDVSEPQRVAERFAEKFQNQKQV